jgi:hypothetical protein
MRAWWLFAAGALAGIGCDAIYGIQQLSGGGGNGGDAGSGKDASVGDGSMGDDSATGEDGGPGDDGPTSDTGGGFVDVQLTCPFDGAVGAAAVFEWAEWPMPNAPTDVEAGAPNPEHYTDNNDGTVTDKVTGLMWEQGFVTDGDIVSNALNDCAELSLAGHCDWRLPTYVELMSLVDVSQQPPPINGHYFPSTPLDAFWSSTPVAGTSLQQYWDVYFSSDPRSTAANVSGKHHGRCVRGGPASDAGTPPGRYVVGSGTVTDLATGLVWQQMSASGTSTWSAAQGFCAGLNLGGPGWRLPTVGELVTIVDVTQMAPAIDSSVFSAASNVYWSSSPVAGSMTWVWGVNFDQGTASSTEIATNSYSVRCVR